MLRLQIESQPLRYELDIQPPQMQLRSELPKLQLETKAATVEIQAGKGELKIDQTPCRYTLGKKNNTDFVRDYAEAGKSAVAKGIGRINQEAQRLSAMDRNVNAVVENAKNRAKPLQGELKFVYLPRPEISYVAKQVKYNPQPGQLHSSFIKGSLSIDSQYGSVDMQITQYPSLSMWTIGSMDMQA